MGIWPKSNPSTAYVPPQSETNQTLLGEGRLPASNLNDDLNRSPATSAELRFRHVVLDGHDTGFDHAYMVIAGNHTGEQRIHQAGPLGPRRLIPLSARNNRSRDGQIWTGHDRL